MSTRLIIFGGEMIAPKSTMSSTVRPEARAVRGPIAAQTPLADALLRVTATGMASLHALPLSAGHSLAGSSQREKYVALFGESYLTADMSLSGQIFDSFFRPRSYLAQAQRLAAEAFGADETLFITGGTTLANQIALEALAAVSAVPDNRPVRVLADRTSHQSIHFWLDHAGAEVTYCEQRYCCDQHGRTWPDLDNLIDLYRCAIEEGRPFDLVVLSAAGYDGAIIDVSSVVTELLQYTDTLTLLADEAWGAINSFHPMLSQYTALTAAKHIRAAYPGKQLRMIVTHSAHKSMSSLRQGSYLHTSGDRALTDAAAKALYRNHTTSPSLPILASLDLARAQAELEGEALIERSLDHARQLPRLMAEDTQLSAFTVADTACAGSDDPRILLDPAKVLLDVDARLLDAHEFRMRLARDYGLYVARTVGTGILLNLHIGVTADIFSRLLTALRDINASISRAAVTADLGDAHFLIAYPPGIPLTVPGQSADLVHEDRLKALRAAGAELFTV